MRLIESGKYDLPAMHSHTLPLEEAERGLSLLTANEAVHIALVS